MGSDYRKQYKVPMTLVFKLAQEGVVCASPTETNVSAEFNGFNDEQEW